MAVGRTTLMLSFNQRATNSDPASGAPGASILVALAPAEIADFFPEPLWSEVRQMGGRIQVLDPRALSTTDLMQELSSSGSEILIAGWKTPTLAPVVPATLRYVCYLAGSVKRVVLREHLEAGLLVSNWGASISRVVAEGALLHILACLRRVVAWSFVMHHDRGWKDDQTQTSSLFGRRVGIHGFGRVARELVRLLRPFGVTIGVHAPDITPTLEQTWEIQRVDTLEDLFSGYDVIAELAPLIPETNGIVSGRLLRLIKPGGIFVNIGRGDLVDEEALVEVAREGRVQFGLDVFSEEPLPADHPLRGLKNVLLTPHLAGPTNERRRDAGAWAVENLKAYSAGLPVAAQITVENYDHMT